MIIMTVKQKCECEQIRKHYFMDGESRVNIFVGEKLTRQLGKIESEGKI